MPNIENDPTAIFSNKADLYDKYRWNYAPAAIQLIVNHSAIDSESIMADIGAGTGILTRNFLDVAGSVFAVEPNEAMRKKSENQNSGHPAFVSIDGRAGSTGLDSSAMDLVVVGQALTNTEHLA